MLYPVLPVFLTQTLGASGFGFGNSSMSFLILQTQAIGVSLDRTILIMRRPIADIEQSRVGRIDGRMLVNGQAR